MNDIDYRLDLAESKCETYKHKQMVTRFMNTLIHELVDRSMLHDNSKLGELESPIFAEFTKKLANTTYNSDEYKGYLSEMKIALDHHYKNNRHHPEFHINGIQDMDLIDLIEMICDWKAATLRHNDGDIKVSIEANQSRFGYSDELKTIFKNTVDRYFIEVK